MQNKRLLIFTVSILMVLIIPIIIYLYNFNSVTFDKGFYKKEFLKYNVYGNLENYDVENINDGVLNYLKKEKDDKLIKNDFFSEREKIHFLDVKNLIQKVLTIYYFSLFLFLLFSTILIFLLKFNFKFIIKKFFVIILFGSILTLFYTLLFFIVSKSNFNFAFDLFHKTFFSFGSYTFNPHPAPCFYSHH